MLQVPTAGGDWALLNRPEADLVEALLTTTVALPLPPTGLMVKEPDFVVVPLARTLPTQSFSGDKRGEPAPEGNFQDGPRQTSAQLTGTRSVRSVRSCLFDFTEGYICGRECHAVGHRFFGNASVLIDAPADGVAPQASPRQLDRQNCRHRKIFGYCVGVPELGIRLD